MDHKKALASLAGALIALGAASASATAADSKAVEGQSGSGASGAGGQAAPELSRVAAPAGKVVTGAGAVYEFVRNGGTLTRERETLVKTHPKHTGMTVGNVPLGLYSRD